MSGGLREMERLNHDKLMDMGILLLIDRRGLLLGSSILSVCVSLGVFLVKNLMFLVTLYSQRFFAFCQNFHPSNKNGRSI
jgi:hypothetical protein